MWRTIIFMLLITDIPVFAQQNRNIVDIANRHPIVMNKPAVSFFEGAVLGNGGMGAIVTTRPDAVCIHFGHNNVWDIRVAENNREEIGTFNEAFEKARNLSPDLGSIHENEEFGKYLQLTADNYHKPYPRPFPCGTVLLGFDRRNIELLGHKIDISNGLCEVYLLSNGKKTRLQIFTDMVSDILWFRYVDEHQNVLPSCFNRLRIIPDNQTPREFPGYTVISPGNKLGFHQVLPYQEPDKYDMEKGHPRDKAFSLTVGLSTTLVSRETHPLERYMVPDNTPLIGYVSLSEGPALQMKTKQDQKISPSPDQFDDSFKNTANSWAGYWEKSGIDTDDHFLEEIWYQNHYFFNCAVKSGVTCPGLFANWSLGEIGTAWHGDYHMNYNTQQPFWLTFSSNRLDKNIPYVDLVYHMLPVAKKWAQEYYGMRGAFFPHSAYPVDMNLHPYPVPDWGWEVFETPWTVQGLWWHYIYSMDHTFLKERAFGPIKEAVLFLVDYMKRPEAHGKQWNDHKYHIFPSVPPELYGLQPGFRYNYDTQIDITLTRFIFKAYTEAVSILGYDRQEKELVADVKQIAARMPEYSKTRSEQYGEIYTSVPGEDDRVVYNVPANLTHVFPGEEYGLDTPGDISRILVNTYRAHQNEGGNDIVFLNLQAARLGILDLERFKRQVGYAMLPNKTVSDLVLQTGGRYNDQTDFAYMAPMGIWFENFALPVVINECLMQSYNGIIRLYPNWDKSVNVSFTTLRAAGAFLVSSSLKNGNTEYIRILSEKGMPCAIKNPWKTSDVQIVRNGKPAGQLRGELLTFETGINEEIELQAKD